MSDQKSTGEHPGDAPFGNPELDVETRIDDLVARLTLDEKIDCLSTNPSVPRLGIRASGHMEGLHGLAIGEPGDWGRGRPVPTTTFPQAIGLAETWDPEIVRQAAAVEAYEARYIFQSSRHRRGGIVIRAPNADLGRDPRWGRTEECYGEDAYLAGCMATAFVRGLQGDHPRYWKAAALLKHFLANSNENGRERSSSDFDEQLLHEYYAAPFRTAIEAGGARAYMAAYNAYNGIPCATHPVLKELTVREWGQDGIICTDGGAFKMLVNEHRFYPDLERAAAAAIAAGITQFLDDYRQSVRNALDRGLLRERDIELAIRKNFRVMIRLGLLDPPELVPYASIGQEPIEPWNGEAPRALCREVTQKSIVLLKNAGALLPLDRRRLASIAVIGPLADGVLPDWYSGSPPYTVSPLEGIRAALGRSALVRHSTGDDLEQAARVAGDCEVALVCAGNHPTGGAGWAEVTRPSYGKEAVDRESLELEDEELVKRVHAANPRTVLVLISSFPYAIEWSQRMLPAIVHLTHSSQELGNALSDVLFGDHNPAGRLVETWPRSIGQLPPMLDYDIRRGRTYQYFDAEPLYPFGFGLAYTSFVYSNLCCGVCPPGSDSLLEIEVDVTNAGPRAGEEVVQLYVARPRSALPRPRKRLIGFRRVPIAPGEKKTVRLHAGISELRHWDASLGRFSLEPGEIEIQVGASSADIRQRETLVLGAASAQWTGQPC